LIIAYMLDTDRRMSSYHN